MEYDMIKPYKKISKRELKQDKFVTYTLKTKEYVENNARLIMWGAVLIFHMHHLTTVFRFLKWLPESIPPLGGEPSP